MPTAPLRNQKDTIYTTVYDMTMKHLASIFTLQIPSVQRKIRLYNIPKY